jgi:tetratricopeptide (TPR) repeat protein
LKRYEEVGVEIGVVFRDFIESIDVKNEKMRAQEATAAKAAALAMPKAPPSRDEKLAEQILKADELITAKRFKEARPLLESVLQEAPALFGLAQVVENEASASELDASVPEEERAASQQERLERAVNLYRQAARNSSTREMWIASWSRVYAGRILDFLDLTDEAITEYQAAVKIGEVPAGAFQEASKRLNGSSNPSPDQPLVTAL